MSTFELVHGSLELPNGIVLSYAESGDPGGVPVVFLHGYSDSHRAYSRLLACLPSWVRAIAVTVRGHGDSSKPLGTYTIAEMASDLDAALQQLRIERAIIAGHSMGSLIAQRFATDFPARTRGLILLGAFRTIKGNAAVAEFFETQIRPLTDPVDREFIREFQTSTLAVPVPEQFLADVIAQSQKLPAHVWRSAMRSMIDDDFRCEAGQISVPVISVWGDQDAYSGRDEQRALAGALRADLKELAGIGHSPHWEVPAEVADLLANFLRRFRVDRTPSVPPPAAP
jgi:non-heme chloroperoxidase